MVVRYREGTEYQKSDRDFRDRSFCLPVLDKLSDPWVVGLPAQVQHLCALDIKMKEIFFFACAKRGSQLALRLLKDEQGVRSTATS